MVSPWITPRWETLFSQLILMKIFIYFSCWVPFPEGHWGLLNINSLCPKPDSGNGGNLLEVSVLLLLCKILGLMLPRCLC